VIVIGERINGQFSRVSKAIDARDAKVIQELALEQTNAGAHLLDINTGPGRSDAPDAMAWLVRTVQDVVQVRLSIDSPSAKVQRAGLAECNLEPLINSTTAEQKRMETFFPIAREYGAEIVCLTINEKGIPNSTEARAEIAMVLLATAMDAGINTDRLFLDPVILPISAAQDQCPVVCDSITALRGLSTPPPRTLVGLSNVSSGAEERSLLNRTFLAMLLGRHLDAAIVDPTDAELMRIVKASEVLLNQRLYARSFLKA